MYTITLLDEEMTKIKVIGLREFRIFVIDDFCSQNHLLFQNLIWSSHFFKFKIWIVQTKSHEKMTKIKVVGLDDF